MVKDLHVKKHSVRDWQVIGEGNIRATGIADTQAEAERKAKVIARKRHCRVFVHKPNGEIRAVYSY